MTRMAAHVALVVAGLAVVLWALTLAAHPAITCRDAVMGPGDVCVDASGRRVQTYEERWAAAQAARPVVAGAGLAVAGFGTVLALQERRRAHA